MTGRFEAKLRAGIFAVTAEIAPPLSADPGDLVARAAPLKGLADAINLTDGAGARAHMSALAAAAILVREGFEPVLQLTCRDRNRIALQSDLVGAAALGVRNLLLLRGDDPTRGDQPETKPVFDLDTSGLIDTAVMIRDRHRLPSGREIAGDPAFFIGVADTPLDPAADWAPASLRSKLAAGAQFAQTQFCMDPGIARRYAARLAEDGLAEHLFLLIGIVPLASARSAMWIRDHLPGSIIPDAVVRRLADASDPRAEGRRICIDMLHQLTAMPGVAGAHVMAPGNPAGIAEVIAEFRSERTAPGTA